MQVQDSNLKNQDQEMKALRYDIEMLQQKIKLLNEEKAFIETKNNVFDSNN